MGLLFNNYLEEGYYEDDGHGYTSVNDIEKIYELQKEHRLYEHDGMGMTKVYEQDKIKISLIKAKFKK